MYSENVSLGELFDRFIFTTMLAPEPAYARRARRRVEAIRRRERERAERAARERARFERRSAAGVLDENVGISQRFELRMPRYAPEGAATARLTAAEVRRWNRDEAFRHEVRSMLAVRAQKEGWIYVLRPSGTVLDWVSPW